LGIVEALGDLDRLKAGGLVERLADAVDIVGLERQQLGQEGKDPIGIVQAVRDDVDPEIGAIAGDRLAAPVQHPAPARRDQGQVDAVALGQQRVFLIVCNGDPAHPARQ
jgi:hypothetical protein